MLKIYALCIFVLFLGLNQASAMDVNILGTEIPRQNVLPIHLPAIKSLVFELLHQREPNTPIELWEKSFHVTALHPEIPEPDLPAWTFAITFLRIVDRFMVAITGHNSLTSAHPIPLLRLVEEGISSSVIARISQWLTQTVKLLNNKDVT